MIKLVAFDWNGTLIADSALASAGDNYALKPYIKRPVTLEDLQQHFTVPVIDYLAALGVKKNVYSNHYKDINDSFNEYYEARVDRCRTRAGVKAALRYCRDQKIETIIYSNHITNYINKQLKRLGIEKYFSAVLARGDNDHSHMHTRGKQKKLYDYVKKHKLKPRQVISVGDTEEEIQVGKNAGYHTVAITGGFNTAKRLKKQDPDFLIHNMIELKKIIWKLQKSA